MTAPVLPSYVRDTWHAPHGEGRPVFDAVTGDTVAHVSTDGIDFQAVLDYGRHTGGPVLRDLTFPQRAALLEDLAGFLRGRRDELYALSARTGATLFDAKFDVDGGLAVLRSYAELGRTALPDARVYVEDELIPLGRRQGSFLGRHVCVPMRGVAVQVNAYNFPVWGPLEKLSQSLLAGVPAVIKPATATAFLTAQLVELVVESGVLPPGSVQLLCGGVGDLFEHLTEQDLLSFTGSAATAHLLRNHPTVTSRAVRLNAEADSLNCSILGPDAAPGTPEFDLYVDQVVTEMTVKAGQKCTAIRRALVPAPAVDAVLQALTDRLGRVTVGNPAADGVRMGPLAGVDQRDEVRHAVAALEGSTKRVFGDPYRVDTVDADPERGAFLSPILLHGPDPDRAEPHEVEPFGPVATVLPYDRPEDAVRLAARGKGSLAGSLVTADAELASRMVLDLAPWHGRILVLSEQNAAESTGHGSPLPQLVHGGPGRAGGGEEMGGLRGMLHHMQRSAVQAGPGVLDALTGGRTSG